MVQVVRINTTNTSFPSSSNRSIALLGTYLQTTPRNGTPASTMSARSSFFATSKDHIPISKLFPSGCLYIEDRASATIDQHPPRLGINGNHSRIQLPWEFPDLANFHDIDSYQAANASFKIFGRDPACTAAFTSFIATQPSTITSFPDGKPTTFGNGSTSWSTSWNVVTVLTGEEGYCCTFGRDDLDCLIHAGRVQMLYFPSPNGNTACLDNNVTNFQNTSIALTKPPNATAPMYATGSDGFI